ncbi:conserved hypothetical protein [Talaromyces stipitatus ATCC 10500]|uniref:ER transporter 6TM N-terminal domain-containing protein n=1 Tax=Talaromyces stipitatus (strain ATCC 10500 / CBS 375.48 / QM 6759 / NRRL 1006) TaxID=441959 RepID=B8MU04_TALSN|nr:uncharacterized protein TSTA_006570 [Talaromyces stipitatus ATCC 10500]EED12637.1 conserved hypothetical protein [Talaromyces stipitatus ATCC 10500]
MVIHPSLRNIGQASFFMIMVQAMCPPAGIETIFIFMAISIWLGMLLAWGWGVIVMKAAYAARPASVYQAQLQHMQQVATQRANQSGLPVATEARALVYEGYMLDARVSAVFLVLGILFVYVISLIRIKNPKFVFFHLFGIIVIDIFITIGPLLPSFNGTLSNLIVVPSSIGLGLAFVASLLLFPQSTSHITLDTMEKIVDMLKIPLTATLDGPVEKAKESEELAGLKATEQGLLGQWNELQPMLGFLKLDLSIGRWSDKDITNVAEDLRKAFIGTKNLLNFKIARLSHTLQSQKTLALPLPGTASSEDNGEDAESTETSLKEKIKRPTDVGFHQLTEFSVFLKAIDDSHSAEIQNETVAMLHENSAEVIQASLEALDSVKELFNTVNTARIFSRLSQETQEQHVKRSESSLENLRAARATFVQKTTEQLLETNAELFDAEGKVKELKMHLRHRFRVVVFGMIFEEHILGVVDGIIPLLETTASRYRDKTRARIWFPARIRKVTKWIFGRAEKAPVRADTQYADPDEIVDQSEVLQEKLGIAKGIGKRPGSKLGRGISGFYRFLVSPDSLYGIRMVVVSIAVAIPAVIPHTAGFYYKQRGLWALIMAQTTLLAYMADFTYSVVARAIGSVVGAVLGLVAWYIGSGNGDGNAFGLAAIIGVLLFPMIYARVILPPQFLMPVVMGAATFFLVVGYGYDYGHIAAYGLPGYGYTIFWRRLLLALIGLGASIIVQVLPRPVSATRHVSRALSNSISTLCDHYALLLSSLGESHNPGLQAVTGQLSIQLSGSLSELDVLITLIKIEISTTNFDSAALRKIKDLCVELNYSLGRLLYITSSLSIEYQELLSREVGLRSHHAIGDVMAVLGVIEQSLKTGDALPEVLPTPLVKRCFDHWVKADMGLIMSVTKARDEEYRKFCTALSSYLRFLAAVDDLVLVMKETLGEAHVVSRELLHQI